MDDREPVDRSSPLSSRAIERRQVTVLFCDLVDSTEFADRLDPEEYRELVTAYQDLCHRLIRRYQGHLAQYLGDGVLAYFGVPVARENDAQGAVRAGLGIVDAMPELGSGLEISLHHLSVRVGIHTGISVVDETEAPGQPDAVAVVGATPNIAARLQQMAAPNTVLISGITHALVEGWFECDDLGTHSIRGVSRPLRLHRVTRESDARNRLDVGQRGGFTPLTGRVSEIAQLRLLWHEVEQGHGRAVVVSGEAGIGKSRLLRELKEQLGEGSYLDLECHCSPYHQHSVLYPVIELLKRGLELGAIPAPEDKLARIREVAARLSLPREESTALLASLVSLTLPEEMALPGLSPARQRQLTMDVLVALLRERAAERPVLLALEDLHWIDPSTLELVERIVNELREMRILIFLSHRPSFDSPWRRDSRIAQVTLERLSSDQTMEMTTRVAEDKALPAKVLEELGERTDGVPLYVEELTRMVLESGVVRDCGAHYELAGQMSSLPIPATLQESLLARLDRLESAHEVAQLAAALGRSFPHELLAAVSTLDEENLRQDLARLVDAQILFRQGTPPAATYMFKHALIQEAAYGSLLRRRRREFHRRIADVYLARFPDTAEAHPELLAHHYTDAGMPERAISYCQLAGEQAMRRSADTEAVSHFNKGLELVASLADSPEREQQELGLLTALGGALMPTVGYAAPEVERVYTRARALCERAGETQQLFSALAGLGYFHQSRAELQTALGLAQRRLELASKLGDPSLEMQACEGVATASFWMGDFAKVPTYFGRCLEIYDPAKHHALAHVYGQDIGVVCRAYGAQALWFLGYPDRALEEAQCALDLARAVAHANSLALATDFAAALRAVRAEWAPCQELAEAAIALSREQEFPFWQGYGKIMRGRALAAQGQAEEGVGQLVDGMSGFQGTGAQLGARYCVALLAEAQLLAGAPDAAAGILESALPALEKNQDRFWDAEIQRLKGELLLQRAPSHEAQAERCLLEALEISRGQSARSLELRAAMSVGRLWQRRGARASARELIGPIVDWFHEGLDTPDLREAKALLESLA